MPRSFWLSLCIWLPFVTSARNLIHGDITSRHMAPPRRTMNRFILGFTFLCMWFSGCDPGSGRSMTASDSAGIRITMSDPVERTYAEVDPDPVLSLGGAGAEGPTQFYQIQDIHVDSQGRLWVADGQSAELRIFLSNGSHLRTVGGRGEGPGEYQRMRLLGGFRGDSVAVWDLGLSRLSVLDEEGNLARTERLVPGESPSVRCSDVFEDGSLLGQVPTIVPAEALEPGRILGDSAHLVRFNPDDSTQRPWATAQGPLWVWTGRNQVPMPFTSNPAFDLRGEELHLASGTDFRVRVFEAGEVIRIYGVGEKPRRVSQVDIQAYRLFVREFIPENARDDHLSPLDSQELPEYLPAYSDVLVSSSGPVWVRLYSSDLRGSGVWHVFDEEGVWLGEVETPPGLWVRYIDKERIVGVWRDEMGVEYVRAHRLHPSGEAT